MSTDFLFHAHNAAGSGLSLSEMWISFGITAAAAAAVTSSTTVLSVMGVSCLTLLQSTTASKISSGFLYILSKPRSPQLNETLRIQCRANLMPQDGRSCKFHWSWMSNHWSDSIQSDTSVTSSTLSVTERVFWKTLRDSEQSSLSTLIVERMKQENQGSFTCTLECMDWQTRSTTIDVQLREVADLSVHRQNSEIGYLVLGLLIFVAVLVSVFRFICINWSTLPRLTCCLPLTSHPPVCVESVSSHPDRIRAPYSVAMTTDFAPPPYAESTLANDAPPSYDSLFDRKTLAAPHLPVLL